MVYLNHNKGADSKISVSVDRGFEPRQSERTVAKLVMAMEKDSPCFSKGTGSRSVGIRRVNSYRSSLYSIFTFFPFSQNHK